MEREKTERPFFVVVSSSFFSLSFLFHGASLGVFLLCLSSARALSFLSLFRAGEGAELTPKVARDASTKKLRSLLSSFSLSPEP